MTCGPAARARGEGALPPRLLRGAAGSPAGRVPSGQCRTLSEEALEVTQPHLTVTHERPRVRTGRVSTVTPSSVSQRNDSYCLSWVVSFGLVRHTATNDRHPLSLWTTHITGGVRTGRRRPPAHAVHCSTPAPAAAGAQAQAQGPGAAPHLHHGLVASQRQEHAGPQLVFCQGQQELFGLVTGAHEDVHLWGETPGEGGDRWGLRPVGCFLCGRFACPEGTITPRCLDRHPTRSPAPGGSRDPSLTQPHVDEPRGHSPVSRSLKDKPQEPAHGRE